jgi:hypothetical protein
MTCAGSGSSVRRSAKADGENIPKVVFSYLEASPPLLFRRPSKINTGLPVQPLIVNASWCVNVESLFLPLHCGGKDLSWSRCGMRSNTL